MTQELDVSKQLIEVLPPLFRRMRFEIQIAADGKLTPPQYRILANIQRGLCHVGLIAQHHGVSQPAMSKMINALVNRKLIRRTSVLADRRQHRLHLTPQGRILFKNVKLQVQQQISLKLKNLSVREKKQLSKSLSCLERVFMHENISRPPGESR